VPGPAGVAMMSIIGDVRARIEGIIAPKSRVRKFS
jgi:hypothetical protein